MVVVVMVVVVMMMRSYPEQKQNQKNGHGSHTTDQEDLGDSSLFLSSVQELNLAEFFVKSLGILGEGLHKDCGTKGSGHVGSRERKELKRSQNF